MQVTYMCRRLVAWLTSSYHAVSRVFLLPLSDS
jgi:hypothetical protein